MKNPRPLPLWNSTPFLLSLILILTFWAFFPALHNEFTQWDDYKLIVDNPLTKSLHPENIGAIFKTLSIGTYIPLTILSFSLEHAIAGYDPFIYHLDNLLLHLLVVALVFLFALKIGLKPLAAFLGTLLFAIHPIHVESVAWAAERKDVLYALFYLLALHAYWNYLQSKNKYFYLFSLLWATLSILAKPMAYSLPLILFLCDWFYRRKISLSLFIEKIPYFLIIIAVSLITYSSNSQFIGYRWDEVVLIWLWTFGFHIQKFIFPYILLPYYELPKPVTIFNLPYAGAVLMFLCFLFIAYRFRRDRWVMMALFFYAVSISFIVIRAVWEFGNLSIVGDRFMYLPSLGFCLLAGVLLEKKASRKGALIIIVLFSLLLSKTFLQNKIWQNDRTLWSYVILKSPTTEFAYTNRALYYISKNRFDLAQANYDKALMLNPKPFHYYARADMYEKMGNWDLAIVDLNQAIELDPNYADAYFLLGNAFAHQGQNDPAITQYTKAISLDAKQDRAYFNRGEIYDHLGKYAQALADYSKAIEINSFYIKAYINRGTIYLGRKDYGSALADFNRALRNDPSHPHAYNNIGVVYFDQGQFDKALTYFNKALTIDPHYKDALNNQAVIRQIKMTGNN